MARARNIKPGFFKNELLVEQPLFVRLLFIGLWTLADREGRVEDRPKRIRLELFPYDDDSVDDALNTLASLGFIQRYAAAGVKVLQIINFLKHQTPHGTEKDSALPAPDGSINVHERDGRGYVTGTKRVNNVKPPPNNVVPPDVHVKKPRKLATTRPDDISQQTWDDWVALRTKKRASVTHTVIAEARRECAKAGLPLERFLQIWCMRGSQGLQADWLKPSERQAPESFKERDDRIARERWEQMTGRIHPDNAITILDAPLLEISQ